MVIRDGYYLKKFNLLYLIFGRVEIWLHDQFKCAITTMTLCRMVSLLRWYLKKLVTFFPNNIDE